MKIVIDIEDEMYELLKYFEGNWLADKKNDDVTTVLMRAIIDGTPLSKKHERLIILSEDAVKREQKRFSFSWQNWISEVGLSNATVGIIEADKE